MARINLAIVEGDLEGPMARRLLTEVGMDTEALTLVVAGGCAAFWERAPSFNQAAAHVGHILGLTDLDNHICPSGLLAQSLGAQPHPRFILRIQVRELESWLLADAVAWADYLNVSRAVVPGSPDTLPDPKRELVNLARRCRRKSIREDIVPKEGTRRVVGPGYTTRIAEFIGNHWNPKRASANSPSLGRALSALEGVAAEPPFFSENG